LANSLSGGNFSPGFSCPEKIKDRNCFTISSAIFLGLIGENTVSFIGITSCVHGFLACILRFVNNKTLRV
jgi:hypothetical protein